MTASPPAETNQPPQNQIGLGAQYVKDLSFEVPNAPQIFAGPSVVPMLEVGVNVQSRHIEGSTFEVALHLKMESKFDTRTAYILELSYAGAFALPNMPEEQLKLFLMVEAPRLLFPFARAVASNTIRESGFIPVMLTPIDFLAMYNSSKGQLGTATAAGVA